MKKFFEGIKACLTKSHIYTKPEHNTASKALAYAAILVLVLSAAKAIVFGIFFFPALGDLRLVLTDTVNKFPADLILTLKDEKLSINKPVPYILPTENKTGTAPDHKNLIVIDTSKDLDLKTFQMYDTSVLVTQDGYMAADNKGGIKIQAFKKIPNYVLSKSVVTNYGTKINGLLSSFSWLIVFLFIIFTGIVLSIGTYIGVLLFSLLGVLITLIVTRIKKHTLSFSQLFVLSVYVYTIVLLFDSVNYLLQWPSWIGFILFVGLTLFVEKKA